MRTTTCATLLSTLIVFALVAAAGATIPEGKIAVILAKDIDGLATAEGPIVETFADAFSFDGKACEIEASALASLEGVSTLLLVNHESESVTSEGVMQKYWQEVIPITGETFEVEAVPELTLEYSVLVQNDQLVLAGGGNQILCPGGEGGPFHVWRVEKLGLLDRSAVKIR